MRTLPRCGRNINRKIGQNKSFEVYPRVYFLHGLTTHSPDFGISRFQGPLHEALPHPRTHLRRYQLRAESRENVYYIREYASAGVMPSVQALKGCAERDHAGTSARGKVSIRCVVGGLPRSLRVFTHEIQDRICRRPDHHVHKNHQVLCAGLWSWLWT